MLDRRAVVEVGLRAVQEHIQNRGGGARWYRGDDHVQAGKQFVTKELPARAASASLEPPARRGMDLPIPRRRPHLGDHRTRCAATHLTIQDQHHRTRSGSRSAATEHRRGPRLRPHRRPAGTRPGPTPPRHLAGMARRQRPELTAQLHPGTTLLIGSENKPGHTRRGVHQTRDTSAPAVVAHAVDEVTSQVSRTSQLRMSEYPSQNTSVAGVICGMSLSETVTVPTVPDTGNRFSWHRDCPCRHRSRHERSRAQSNLKSSARHGRSW
jgi:hypothetical protein